MDKYDLFKEQVKRTALEFKKLDKKKTVRLISHLDADGISACAILIRLLNNLNMKYSLSIIQTLTQQVIDELSREKHEYFIFSDIGSNNLTEISEALSGRKVFVLDHHSPQENLSILSDNLVFLNPHVFDIDGGKEICGAGVVYLFAKEIDKKIEELSHIAIIGALGDVQEDKGFLRLNDEILQTAIKKGKIKLIKGLRIFGAQTRPLYKALEYCTDPFIPGVSGSESGAIQFLNQIGINPKKGVGWRKLVHLSEEDIKKLVTGIIMKRLNFEDKPEDVLGNVYILKEEEKEGPTRDAKEFATLLNACGRLGKASLGVGACLGDKKIKKRAIDSLGDYRKEIVNSIKWYEKNKKTEFVYNGKGYVIINTLDCILPTIVGTLASILAKSNNFPEGTHIITMARLGDETTKASLRLSGNNNKECDLKSIVEDITRNIPDSEAGGHKMAAGAIIPTSKEKEFIKKTKEIFDRKAIEEEII